MSAPKVARTTFLDSRIDALDKRLQEFEVNLVRNVKKLAEKIEVCREETDEESKRSEQSANDQLTKLLKRRQDQLGYLEKEVACRRAQEDQIIRLLDQQTTTCKTDIQREALERNKSIADMRKTFETEMNTIADGVRQEGAGAEAAVSAMTTRFGGELEIVGQNLEVELSNRADLSRAVVDMKADIQLRARNELETISAARKASQAEIQKMLEIANLKVNQGI